MLDNLVLAYRSEIYDWDLKETADFYKKNKKILWGFIVFVLAVIAAIIYSVVFHASVWMLIILLVELVIGIAGDRLMVKRHQQFIFRKQDHINKVVLFLKTAIPDSDLFCKKRVEELINRLSNRIDIGAPFNKFKSSLCNFGKFIILPIITYIAGIYTANIRELEFVVVLTFAISFILIIGLCYVTWGMLVYCLVDF